ncbi:conserved hypothetical protein [Hyella patelloides LEGE 07179]|uniref:Type IV pilin PilA n=1 Tax=Hyella patelloides LEGE 07179 TaxID=945734 RepID=A0A563VNN1_9CYAN|nr:hypothetical protein [Hyella patelloides]VEP12943.1 conserved hypothetical protein [Hyella patelloides LEGE 07179]
MSVKQSDYEKLLAEYSCRNRAIALLKQYRPYLETLPSTRRPEESLITIPLPVIRVRQPQSHSQDYTHINSDVIATSLPCDLGIVMCDPEWKIKMGTEILIFIHRPHEDFSQLLSRWRKTQVYLDRDYEWIMPLGEEHILSEAAEKIYPLFVLFDSSPERIKQGLKGAGLPFVICESHTTVDEETNHNTIV